MTNPTVYSLAAVVADKLLASGLPLLGFDGLDDGQMQFNFKTRDGLTLQVLIDTPVELDEAQARVRAVLQKFEGANRNGFDRTGATASGLPGETAP